MSTLYFECSMGAAGDMLMSALYELCDKKEDFLQTMNTVFAPYDISLEAEAAAKCGVYGTHMHVFLKGTEEDASLSHAHSVSLEHTHNELHVHTHTEEHGYSHDAQNFSHDEHSHNEHVHTHDEPDHSHDELSHDEQAHHHAPHHHASYQSVLDHIHTLALPSEVKRNIKAIYNIIGNAEAKVHNTTLEQIHFHEVGTLDALADVAGCAYLIYLLAPDEILASPIHVGSGFVHCAHGVLPVPAPATAEILKGVPFYTGSITGELCTPTGAAILKHFVSKFSAMPTMTSDRIGYGMGKKDFEIANCVRSYLGKRFDNTDAKDNDDEYGFDYDDSVLSISCNLDDMTGEALGLATEILLTAGALDVFTTPVQMKKNRPGILLTCICKPEERDKFTALFFLHTTTRGVRYQQFQRAKLESTTETRHTSYGDIRIKKSSGYGIEKEKPEFEDLKAIVLKHNYSISLEDIRQRTARNSHPHK